MSHSKNHSVHPSSLISILLIFFLSIGLTRSILKTTTDDQSDPSPSSCSTQPKEGTTTTTTKSKKGHRLSGYYPVYNSEFQLPSAIPYKLYTDLIFFVATPEANFTIGTGGIEQDEWDQLAHDFVKRSKAAGVQPRYAVGGWTDSRFFSDLVLNQKNRERFSNVLKKFGLKYGFEGVDLDWEYPNDVAIGCNVYRPSDLENFGLFIATLRRIWPQAELSAAVALTGLNSVNGSATKEDVKLLVKNLDFINIMAYDVFGGWSDTTGPNAPFRSDCAPDGIGQTTSIVDSVKVYKSLGFKDRQIVIGLPGYGRAFRLIKPVLKTIKKGNQSFKIYQEKSNKTPEGGLTDDPPGIDVCGNQTDYEGLWRYVELIDQGFLTSDGKKGQKGFKRYFDDCSQTPFIANQTIFISYDDEQSFKVKTKFAKTKGLAGVFVFDTQGPDEALLKSTKQVLVS